MVCARPIVAVLTLIAFGTYGCVPYYVVHRKNTPIDREVRIASGPHTTTVRELTLLSRPTVVNPRTPVTLAYFERVTGPEEEVMKFEERKYQYAWSPFHYPIMLMFLPIFLGLKLAGVEGQPVNEDQMEWGCPYTNTDFLRYWAVAIIPCFSTGGSSLPLYKGLPVAEEVHSTGRMAEKRQPLAQQPLEVKVVAHGIKWTKEAVSTVVTNDEGQQTVSLDSLFKDFPDVPSEGTVIVTAEGSETTMRVDSELCAVLYRQVRH